MQVTGKVSHQAIWWYDATLTLESTLRCARDIECRSKSIGLNIFPSCPREWLDAVQMGHDSSAPDWILEATRVRLLKFKRPSRWSLVYHSRTLTRPSLVSVPQPSDEERGGSHLKFKRSSLPLLVIHGGRFPEGAALVAGLQHQKLQRLGSPSSMASVWN